MGASLRRLLLCLLTLIAVTAFTRVWESYRLLRDVVTTDKLQELRPSLRSVQQNEWNFKKKTYVVWTYPMAPTRVDILAPDEVLLCAYQSAACQSMLSERINLRELTIDTPYYGVVLNQMMQKVIHGRNYSDHVQSVTILSLLRNDRESCVRSWGDSVTLLCHQNLTQFADYDPTLPSSTAPLVPVSKPDMESLQFNSLTYGNGGNSGDEIQSLTGIQFMPFISGYFHRDFGWPRATGNMFANAWYGFTFKFPPSLARVDITMVAVHYVGKGQDVMKTEESKKFLREYTQQVGPVGARDSQTLAFLQALNVPSYLSRCLTLMLQLGCHCQACPPCANKQDIVLHDVNLDELPQHVVDQLGEATRLTAQMKPNDKRSFATKFAYAHNLLLIYANRAKVVITSRLHSALPAFALGVPVIFVNSKTLPGGSSARLEGILELLHVYRPRFDNWTFDLENMQPNPGLHAADRNRASFWNYLKRRSSYYEDTARLHGMIPLQRLGKDLPSGPIHETFHFIAPVSITWRFVRSIEYVFFHHPNARVTVHTSTLPATGTRLDIFRETGYELTVESYDTLSLLKQVVRKGASLNSFLSDLDLLQKDPLWTTHEADLVRFLILYRDGGVFLGSDMYLAKSLPIELQNVVGGEGTSSIMIMEPHHDTTLAAVNWIIENYKNQQQQWTGRSLLSAVLETTPLQFLHSMKQDEFNPFHNNMSSCFMKKLDIVLSNAYAVHIDSGLTRNNNVTARGSSCDEFLHKYCIFCDEIHTDMPAIV